MFPYPAMAFCLLHINELNVQLTVVRAGGTGVVEYCHRIVRVEEGRQA